VLQAQLPGPTPGDIGKVLTRVTARARRLSVPRRLEASGEWPYMQPGGAGVFILIGQCLSLKTRR